MDGLGGDRGVRVFVVDDDRASRFMLTELLADLGYEVAESDGGEDALRRLNADPSLSDVVLLDRMMPGVDGLEVVRRMAATPALRRVPVVMVTGAGDAEEVREGIEAGVFYYLAKPVAPNLLASVVSAAVRQARMVEDLAGGPGETVGFDCAMAARYRFRALSDAERLGAFVANYFPDPARALPGVVALLVNAVEHGLCGVGFERKGALLQSGDWRAEVERLCAALPPERFVEATVARRDGGVAIAVVDPGDGFRWREHMALDMSRAASSHGRGLLEARARSFDRLQFNEAGNQVVGFMRAVKELEW